MIGKDQAARGSGDGWPRPPASGGGEAGNKQDAPPPKGAGGEPWAALWQEEAEGALQQGDEPLSPGEVEQLWSDLQGLTADLEPVPPDLVARVTRALMQVEPADAPGAPARPTPAPQPVDGGAGFARQRLPRPVPPGPRRPRLVQLARLLGAEARWLPLLFLALELLLMAGGLLLHLVAVETAQAVMPGSATAVAPGSPPSLSGWRLVLLSADSLALVAPWLGTLVALAAAWPRRQQLWADLEALSPFPAASRLLARTWVAGLLATLFLLVAGWIQPAAVTAALGPAPGAPGPDTAPAVLPVTAAGSAGAAGTGGAMAVVLARVAPLWLAATWALWWQMRTGTLGAMLASAGLWTAVTFGGHFLGPWNPLAAGPLPAAGVQGAMLLAAVLLAWGLLNRTGEADAAT